MGLGAAAIKLDPLGPVLFKQDRIGKDGKVFQILKFRSMTVGAEHTGSGVYSRKGDTRVTRGGKIIRDTRVDELPQLINSPHGAFLCFRLQGHRCKPHGAGSSRL